MKKNGDRIFDPAFIRIREWIISEWQGEAPDEDITESMQNEYIKDLYKASENAGTYITLLIALGFVYAAAAHIPGFIPSFIAQAAMLLTVLSIPAGIISGLFFMYSKKINALAELLEHTQE